MLKFKKYKKIQIQKQTENVGITVTKIEKNLKKSRN